MELRIQLRRGHALKQFELHKGFLQRSAGTQNIDFLVAVSQGMTSALGEDTTVILTLLWHLELDYGYQQH